MRRDAARAETGLTLTLPQRTGALEGRAIRVGNFWTVIRAADRTGVTVWRRAGECAAGVHVEIASSYRLRPR